MSNDTTRTWPELAVARYDRLTGRGAEIRDEFSNREVEVPASAAPDAPRARRHVNGTRRVRTRAALRNFDAQGRDAPLRRASAKKGRTRGAVADYSG